MVNHLVGGCFFLYPVYSICPGNATKKAIAGIREILYTDSGKRAIELLSGASQTRDRWEVVHMTTYEAISLMISFGMLLIALLTYIDRKNKRK